MNANRIRGARLCGPLLLWMLLASCGGGGSYSISVSPTSISLSGITGDTGATQNVNVSFDGEGLVVGTLPGQSVPDWIHATVVAQTTSSAVVAITGSGAAAGDYSTTLRFVTGKADGSKVAYKDVAVAFHLVAGQAFFANTYGLAIGSTVSASLNGAAAVPLTGAPAPQYKLGVAAIGSSYTVSIPTQPTGQNCSFDNGSATLTGTVPATLTQLRVSCNATLVPWTWAGGSKTIADAPVVPPVRGGTGPSYRPGGRVQPAFARDAQGNLWVFGGRDPSGLHNDLWKFTVSTQQWTWVAGSTALNAAGNYGTRNVAASSNVPGARSAGAAWVDASGNFWLFGGQGFSSGSVQFALNDLWVYNVVADQWTWVGGANGANVLEFQGVYTTTPATTNIPGGRYDFAVTQDAAGAVWLFGGNGLGDQNSFGRMNDLWKFDPATRVWSWMSGDHQPTGARVQGALGVPDPANVPSARAAATLWTDATGGVWMFGGTNAVLGFENDLWRFNSVNKVWTWMGGVDRTNPSTSASVGTYLPPGTTSSNYPTSRAYASAWKDSSGNFWLSGGYGQTSDINVTGGINDLWKFTPGTNTWFWQSGANSTSQPSIYGTQGGAANTNMPGSRLNGITWIDANGHLWLFGGSIGFNPDNGLSDLWYVSPP